MQNLKRLFDRFDIDGYIVPKNDEYFNEYVSSSKDRLKFISNFSGSAGFAIIMRKRSYLFIDGRYTSQAHYQSGKKFKIITVPMNFPKDIIKPKKKVIVGFDPNLHTENQLKVLFKIKNISLKPLDKNLIDMIWHNKPRENVRSFYTIPTKYIGQNREKKINEVKKILLKNKLDYFLITAPENIAWILNIRGYDTSYSPIPNARLLISKNGRLTLFSNLKKIEKIKNLKIEINDEKIVKDILLKLNKKIIGIDTRTCSVFLRNLLREKNKVQDKIDPIYFLKSIKNKTEIDNMKKCHLIDGVALTKFVFWLKKNILKKRKITEISAQKKLESFRKNNKKYKFPSFSTISGSGPNSSIIHYKATPKTNRVLRKGELYLVDSGGQYHFGTTDVTRTLSFGNIPSYIKDIYTRVLKGHIAVSSFKIKEKTTGAKIDIMARKYLKKINLDYPHGTGHGIGYFLNVHEGPQSISKKNKVNLKNGMILSNEPGFYKKASFGIRIENLVYIHNKRFKELTMVPIEKSLINKKILNKKEKNWLNDYHNKVRNNLYRFMVGKDKENLNIACSPIN